MGRYFFKANEYGVYWFGITLFGNRVFTFSHSAKHTWFEFFGRGLSFKPKRNGLNFSQRNGLSKYIILFGYIISYLTKVKFP